MNWLIRLFCGDCDGKITVLTEEKKILTNDLKETREQITVLEALILEQEINTSDLIKVNNDLTAENDELKKLNEPSVLYEELKKVARVIEPIAYKNKRKILGDGYSVYLQELITPEAWEVVNFKRGVPVTGDAHEDVQAYGDKLAVKLTWKDDGHLDKSGDYYLMPNETLTHETVDCEDHAFCLASMNDKLFGVGYGIFYDGTNNYYHAYNIYYNAEDKQLWIADTVGNRTVRQRLKDNKMYDTYYVITKESCFEIKGGIQFGYLANWHK